ncbi:MAG: bifunctional diguanylate cyclase/phosphodiesterase [Sphingomonadales bacterium]|nr:bifunctional diguanylate cyclase/phosphodiesterase [Sphingomonadales bacterium]
MHGDSVMLLSFAHRDALSAQLAALGCRVTAARRIAGIERRFAVSQAAPFIVDVRDASEEGIAAIARLAPVVEAQGGALIAVYERRKKALLPRLVEAGVSQVLAAPFSDTELASALQLAGRACRRRMGLPAPVFPIEAETGRDTLTGFSDAQALRHWINARLTSQPVALLLIDMARFDVVNSAFGREAGDAALRAVAHRIEPLVSETVGADALFARMRGAEFAIAFAGEISNARLGLLAEAIVDTVARPFSSARETLQLGCRIGIVRALERDRTALTLLRRANAAIKDAGVAESGPVRFLVGDAAEAAMRTESLAGDLRAAITRGQIDILFQPQVAIATGRIEGVEALARWNHPRHGEIGAATLFAVAEQSDHMIELSRHVHKKAVRMAAEWPEALSHLRLSINVTAADLAVPRFARSMLMIIDEAHFPRERMTIEVTESGLMGDLEAAARVLNQLRAGGCRVAIDDFGTGYSSLAYLNALPADYLKIDKGFADGILRSERASLVVKSVIGLARSLGLSVVAEGVESEGQLALLAREGCSHYQGFLRSRPINSVALEEMVRGEG